LSNPPIYVSKGMAQYVGGVITEKTHKDITTTTIQLALGSADQPPTTGWADPDIDISVNTYTRQVKMLIDAGQALGTYWLWAKITDNPEIIPVRGSQVVVVD
jgi:hypothetical protein